MPLPASTDPWASMQYEQRIARAAATLASS